MGQVDVTKHMFGRDIVHRFIPMVAGEAYDIASSLFVEARLYLNSPSGSTLTTTSDSNAIEVVTSGFKIEGDHEHFITFTALTDSDTGLPGDYVYRYAVVNFRDKSGGPLLYLVDRLTIWRTSSITSRMRLDMSAIEALDYQLYKLIGESDISIIAREARRDLIHKLKSLDKDVDNFFDLEELDAAFKYRTLAYMARSRANEDNQFWFQKYKDYLSEEDKFFTTSAVGYSGEKDSGTPKQQAYGGPMTVIR